MTGIIRSITILFISAAILLFMDPEVSAQSTGKASRTNIKAPEISYIVSMSKPWTHLLEVEMRVKSDQMPENIELKMPVWTPGSYLVREFARHVQDFSAKNPVGGELAWRKTNKNTWQVDSKRTDEIVVKYRVYSNELT